MAWTLTEDLEIYIAATSQLLTSQPVHNTLLLSILDTLRVGGKTTFGDDAPRYGWWTSASGDVLGGFLVTPPYPVVLTLMPAEAISTLPKVLMAEGVPVAAVNAEKGLATVFAEVWAELADVKVVVQRRMRLFVLDRLVPPDPWPEGSARLATMADSDLVESWLVEFGVEIGEAGRPGMFEEHLGYGGMTLWEASGVPVAVAGRTRAVEGVARIGPVYTPVGQRRRGYGGAATVAATQAALDQGVSEMTLFTDLSNPTSNALYQRLGYHPLQDNIVMGFIPNS